MLVLPSARQNFPMYATALTRVRTDRAVKQDLIAQADQFVSALLSFALCLFPALGHQIFPPGCTVCRVRRTLHSSRMWRRDTRY